ncbi:MAG: hydroxyacylglutathione hydrolase [Myxococcota bacterium]
MRHLCIVLLLAAGCGNSVRTEQIGAVSVTTLRRGYSNVHLIESGDAVVVFDGGYASEVRHLTRVLELRNLTWVDIDAVIVSHGHADHAGGAEWISEQAGAPIVVGEGDSGRVTTGTKEPLCPTSGWARRRAKRDFGASYMPFAPDVLVPVNAGLPLSDLLSQPNLPGEVIAEPGHTDGSLMYVVGGVAFVGDLFRGSLLGNKAVRHFYICDLEDNALDVRALLDSDAPNAQVFFPGHFGPVTRDSVEDMLEEWDERP